MENEYARLGLMTLAATAFLCSVAAVAYFAASLFAKRPPSKAPGSCAHHKKTDEKEVRVLLFPRLF